MLESIFFAVTTFFSLLFLILSVSLENWPCGGVFAPSCQENSSGYPIKPVGVLICISLILYFSGACIYLGQVYFGRLVERMRRLLVYVALGLCGSASLFVVSAMLAFFNLYMHSWSIMLSLVGMTLGCSLTFQIGMRLTFDIFGKKSEIY